VALESTGVYWRPVYNVLEHEQRTLLLVNPQHMRAVPGKKTDVKDAEWLADLLRHGLLRASFIPPESIRILREMTRYRKTLVQQHADEANRLQKTLEGANIKLSSSPRSRPTCSASAAARCSQRCWMVSRTLTSWPTWPAEDSEPSCLSCARRWRAVSSRTTWC